MKVDYFMSKNTINKSSVSGKYINPKPFLSTPNNNKPPKK